MTRSNLQPQSRNRFVGHLHVVTDAGGYGASSSGSLGTYNRKKKKLSTLKRLAIDKVLKVLYSRQFFVETRAFLPIIDLTLFKLYSLADGVIFRVPTMDGCSVLWFAPPGEHFKFLYRQQNRAFASFFFLIYQSFHIKFKRIIHIGNLVIFLFFYFIVLLKHFWIVSQFLKEFHVEPLLISNIQIDKLKDVLGNNWYPEKHLKNLFYSKNLLMLRTD